MTARKLSGLMNLYSQCLSHNNLTSLHVDQLAREDLTQLQHDVSSDLVTCWLSYRV